MSTLKVNQWLNSDGTENYKCRAWVNFNGTGTVAIRASGNVTSITDNGTGDYTVNFTTAMPDANYATNVTSDSGNTGSSFRTGTAQTVSALRVISYFPGTTFIDVSQMSVSIFR